MKPNRVTRPRRHVEPKRGTQITEIGYLIQAKPADAHVKLCALYELLGTNAAVASKLDVDVRTVERWVERLVELGYKSPYERQERVVTEFADMVAANPAGARTKLTALRARHGSWTGVAEHLGVAAKTVYRWVERLGGFEKAPRGPRKKVAKRAA